MYTLLNSVQMTTFFTNPKRTGLDKTHCFLEKWVFPIFFKKNS